MCFSCFLLNFYHFLIVWRGGGSVEDQESKVNRETSIKKLCLI